MFGSSIKSNVRKFIKTSDSERLRRLICNVNWKCHRGDLLNRLNVISSEFNSSRYRLTVRAQQGQGTLSVNGKQVSDGLDSIEVTFWPGQMTGIAFNEPLGIVHELEKPVSLFITHSDEGHDSAFLVPAKSCLGKSIHKNLFVYASNDGRRITDKDLKKMISKMLIFQMGTSHLYSKNIKLRFELLRIKLSGFFRSYRDSEDKFKAYSGIYIPIWVFLIPIIWASLGYLLRLFKHHF